MCVCVYVLSHGAVDGGQYVIFSMLFCLLSSEHLFIHTSTFYSKFELKKYVENQPMLIYSFHVDPVLIALSFYPLSVSNV